jgi:hypothetical protein
MRWRELEQKIEERTKAIWLDEPEDLRRIRSGVVDSGAGSYGQWFTTILFAQSEVRGLCFNAATNVLIIAEDESYTLDQLKKLARVSFTARTGFLNYVGMHELGELFNEYLDLLDSIDSRDAFVRLTRALRQYGVRLHLWSEYSFPWDVGLHLQQLTPAVADRAAADVAEGPWQPVSYLLS